MFCGAVGACVILGDPAVVAVVFFLSKLSKFFVERQVRSLLIQPSCRPKECKNEPTSTAVFDARRHQRRVNEAYAMYASCACQRSACRRQVPTGTHFCARMEKAQKDSGVTIKATRGHRKTKPAHNSDGWFHSDREGLVSNS